MSDLGPCPVCQYAPTPGVACLYCVGTGRLRYISWVDSPWSEIIPGLWVGSHEYQPNRYQRTRRVSVERLEGAGFDVVASLVDMDCPPPEHVVHLSLIVEDDASTPLHVDDIDAAHDMAAQVAEHVQAGRKVLVRCHAGLNRSSLVAALAMVRLGHEPAEAIETIRTKRSIFALYNQRFVEIIMAQASQESTP